MRKLAAALLLAVLCLNCFAQQKQIDSLRKAIAHPKDDTSRINAINSLASAYDESKPDSELLLGAQAIQLSKAINFERGERIGLSHQGSAFNAMGNYPKALACFLSGLKMAEKIHNFRSISAFLSDIGAMYANERDYRQSIYYYQKGLLLARSSHNESLEPVDLLDIGDAYEKLNVLDSALLYARQAFPITVKMKNKDFQGGVLNNIGNVYVKLHKTDSALYYYRRAFPLLKQSNDDLFLCETTLGMANVFRQLNMPDSSLYYARQSIAGGWRGGFTDQVMYASQFLTAYFKQQGRLDSAFRYQEVSITAKDSLFSQEKTKELQNLRFAEQQRQQEIQEQEIAYKTSVRYYVLLAVIIFLVAMAIVFWRNSNQRRKANNVLTNTLGELKTTQNQLVQSAKMASLGELTAGIAHEIQNPLNFVNNFSEVNEEMLDELKAESEKPKAKRNEQLETELINDIIENQKKIKHHGKRADFIVKGMLEHSRTSTGERQATNINVLADEFLKLSYHGLRAKDKDFNAELVTNFDTTIPRINIAQQDIGRVLLNLYNNAFYAVNQKAKTAGSDYKPMVEVSTAQQNGSVIISVKDNGTGIPENIREKIMQPFFTTKPTGEGTGLGLSLSYDIVVKGHGGKIDVDTKEGEGSEFIITLPC